MQAIVLVGGEGTRLRPADQQSVPKPALTLVDRPFLAYMVEWLAGHGVDEVVLACGFLPDVLREALGDDERSGARDPLRRRARAAAARPARSASPPTRSATSSTSASSPSTATSLTDLDLTALLADHDASAAPGRRSACTRSTTQPPTASSAATTRAQVLEFLEKTGEHGARRGQRRHVRARALGARSDPGRARRSRSSARSSRGWSGDGLYGTLRSTATGWTSAPPSATCRRAGTSSRARSRPRGRADRPGRCSSTPPPRSPQSAVVGPRAVIGAGCRLESGRRGPRLGPARRLRRRIGRADRAARSSPPASWSSPAPRLEGAVIGRNESVPAS